MLDEVNIAAQCDQFDSEIEPTTKLDSISRVRPENRTFGIPVSIWTVMFASYAVFFTGLTLATGHDKAAIFMIVISVLYTLMYFGTAFAINNVGTQHRTGSKSQWKNGAFDTFTGPMSYGAVFWQMLIVPVMLAIFGIAIAIIRPLVV